jgi:hypothetical protein
MASTASKNKLTLRMSDEDARRLDALREQRKLRLAQADGVGPPDRVSRTSLALHYMRLGMSQAERAGRGAAEAATTPARERG